MNVLLVGEAPSRLGGGAFEGPSGARLDAVAPGARGVAELRNLLQEPQPRGGKGSAFPCDAALAAARELDLRDVDVLLMAGRRVAMAFGVPASIRYLEPVTVRGRVAYVVPHPSGVNR